MNDCEFLLEVLADGQWRSLNEILRRSFDKRGHGLTIHSRASDLRKRGHIVEHRTVGKRGAGSEYRLVSERGDLAVSPPSRPGLTARDGVSPLADQLSLAPPPRRGAYTENAA